MGCRLEDGDEIVEESTRQRLRRALLDHVFPSASTSSVLKVDEEVTPLPTDPGFILVDTPSRGEDFGRRCLITIGMNSSGMTGLVYCDKA